MADQTCPDCGGAGSQNALVMRSGVCELESMACSVCKGAGRVDEAFMERRAEGQRIRSVRVGRGISLREAAEELGITPAELSAREHGQEVQP